MPFDLAQVTGVMVGAFNLSSLGFACLNFLYFNYNGFDSLPFKLFMTMTCSVRKIVLLMSFCSFLSDPYNGSISLADEVYSKSSTIKVIN